MFARVEDDSDAIEAVVFPKFLESNGHLFKQGSPVRFKGRTEVNDEGMKFFPEQGEILEKTNNK